MKGLDIDNACDQLAELSEAITTILFQLSVSKVEKGDVGWEGVFEWKKKAKYALAIKQVEHSILKCEIKVYRRKLKEEAEARNEKKGQARLDLAKSRDSLFIHALKAALISYLGRDEAAEVFRDCGDMVDSKLIELASN